MKILSIMNEKGGVGKTFVVSQLAFYAECKRGYRTIVLDLDQQLNTTRCLKERAVVASLSAGEILLRGGRLNDDERKSPFLLVPGDNLLAALERLGEAAHPKMIENLYDFLADVESSFDLCIIDTNPSPDIRAIAAMSMATHVLSPIELKQESLDGVMNLIGRIERTRNDVNPDLQFIGLLPNLVEKKPYQEAALKTLIEEVGQLLLIRSDGRPALVPNSAAVAEAQGEGRPLWEGPKTKVGRIWSIVRKVWEEVEKRLNLERPASIPKRANSMETVVTNVNDIEEEHEETQS